VGAAPEGPEPFTANDLTTVTAARTGAHTSLSDTLKLWVRLGDDISVVAEDDITAPEDALRAVLPSRHPDALRDR
jgi:hypothetical protein